jgi:hypothetical protein
VGAAGVAGDVAHDATKNVVEYVESEEEETKHEEEKKGKRKDARDVEKDN